MGAVAVDRVSSSTASTAGPTHIEKWQWSNSTLSLTTPMFTDRCAWPRFRRLDRAGPRATKGGINVTTASGRIEVARAGSVLVGEMMNDRSDEKCQPVKRKCGLSGQADPVDVPDEQAVGGDRRAITISRWSANIPDPVIVDISLNNTKHKKKKKKKKIKKKKKKSKKNKKKKKK
jgi:hypothetical protein